MKTGFEDISELQRRFTRVGWLQSFGGLAVAVMTFAYGPSVPYLGGFDPLVLTLFILAVYALPWILSEFPGDARKLGAWMGGFFVLVAGLFLWINDPLWSMRAHSVVYFVFAVGHGLMWWLRTTLPTDELSRFRRFQRSEFARFSGIFFLN